MYLDRRLIILGAFFAVFLIIGYVSDQRVMQAANELIYLAEGIEAAVHMEDWFTAEQLLDKISTRWPITRRTWDLRMDRDEMDEFDLCLARLQGYAGQKEKAGALAELAVWHALLIHVQQKEVFRWRNLL
ncbi:MAG: DUF4363 family protein [Firmicutes bacterium]|nr:DUF4363 family protein [Bacillota bacterium]